LERARRISVLRQLDRPLATVAETLAGIDDEEVLARLNHWWAAQEGTNAARKATVESATGFAGLV
jgi:hypothetical protein